jgi:hypothetical protein
VRVPSEFPAEWGRTKLFVLEYRDAEWFPSDWYDLVDKNEKGELDHSFGGCIPAETVVLAMDEEAVALGDVFNMEPINEYAWDNEYYLVLRVREVLDAERWRTLPFQQLGPGNVVVVWDKFHGIAYVRGQYDPTCSLSYGGDWSHLEEMLSRAHPPARPPERTDAPSPVHLLSAVRRNDLPRVRELLAQGVSAHDMGAPDGVRCLELGVSMGRTSSPLWESIQEAAPEITEALLSAGAGVDSRIQDGPTPLHVAIIARKAAHVRVLIRFGANPRLSLRGKTALELADAIGPELASAVRGT